MRFVKLSPVSEKRPPGRLLASAAVRGAEVTQILPFGRCFGTSWAVQLSKNFLTQLLKVLPLFSLPLDFLGPPCYPARVLLLQVVIFPPKGINMHVIVTFWFPLFADHLSVSNYF